MLNLSILILFRRQNYKIEFITFVGSIDLFFISTQTFPIFLCHIFYSLKTMTDFQN